MKMKMKKVTAAVAMSVGVSALGINAVQADSIMFPVITVSDTVTTILSVVNTQDRNLLHYAYFYKTGADATDREAVCEEINFDRPTSLNDLATYDVGGNFGSTVNVLFDDPSINADYGATQSFAALRNVKPARAFGLIDNNRTGGLQGTTAPGEDNTLYGEAILLEMANGAAWGYRAYNAVDSGGQTRFDFSNSQERTGEVIADSSATTHLLPFDEFTTRFFVTPIASDDQRQDNLNAKVFLEAPASGDIGVVMYDRDENLVSGQVRRDITCVGTVDARDLLSQASAAEFPNGGWSEFNVTDGTASVASGKVNVDSATVFKLEFNLTSSFEGVGVGGVFNNAVWLRRAPGAGLGIQE